MAKGPIDLGWEAVLRKMLRWQRNFRVTGAASFKNTEDGCSIAIGSSHSTGGQAPRRDSMWIQLGEIGLVQDGSNKRWKYPWTEVEKTSEGYGGWTALTRGGPGDTYGYAYNTIEDPNGSTGLYGNGVSSSNLSGTFDIQRVPVSKVIVRAWIVRVNNGDPDTLPEVWFAYENGVDGTC